MQIAEIVAYLKATKQELLVRHVGKPVKIINRPRQKKRSRLTGEMR